MTLELLSSVSMAHPYRTDWFRTKQTDTSNGKRRSVMLQSLQISWSGVTDPNQSSVRVLISNDGESFTQAAEFTVDSTANPNDALVAFVRPMFRFFCLEIVPLATSSGSLTVWAYYGED